MNQCIFIGNLTADPELRYSTNGTETATFSIAINERAKDGKEVTTYVDFVCWDKLAKTVTEYARKGRKVAVTSAFHLRRWEAEDGSKRSKAEFRARNVEFLDKPPQDQRGQQQQQVDDTEIDDLTF